MDQFLLFGDSITQQSFAQDRGFAFGAALSDAYVRRLDVVNRGLSGYNTRQALQVLERVIPSPEQASIRLLTVFFGANDARLPNMPGGPDQHVPLEEFRQNVKAIVTHPKVRAHEGIRLILITPPALDERKCLEGDKQKYPEMPNVLRRKASVTAQYAKAVCDLGEELSIPTLDLFNAMIRQAGGGTAGPEPLGSIEVPVNESLRDMVHDGLHMSSAGYSILFEETATLIRREFPDQTPEQLPFVLPAWDNEKAWSSQASL